MLGKLAPALVLVPFLLAIDSTAPLGSYSERDRKHWAFQPRSNPTVPQFSSVADKAWVKTPVDAFILDRLRKEGLQPTPPADRATLLRRVYFDLIGMPPTPPEIPAFMADSLPGSFSK